MITSYNFSNYSVRVENLSIGMLVAAYLRDRKYTIPVKFLGMYREEDGRETITDSVAISKMQNNEYYLVEDLEDGRIFKIKREYAGRITRLVWGISPVSFREISNIRED